MEPKYINRNILEEFVRRHEKNNPGAAITLEAAGEHFFYEQLLLSGRNSVSGETAREALQEMTSILHEVGYAVTDKGYERLH